MPTRFPFLEWPGPIPFAHRGGASEAPENTMPAFAHAVDLGFRYVETDVHATLDGVVVAFHDDRLDRVTDGAGRIADLRWSAVSAVRVAGTEPIPLLEDLLGTWPALRVNIDPKHDRVVEPLVEVLRRTGAVGRVCAGAFSERRIARLRRLVGPDLCTSLGPAGVARLRWAATTGRSPGRLAAACAQVPLVARRVRVVDRRFVAAAHGAGLPVHVWTIDDAGEMERLLDLGVDGIMTDRPAVLRGVLERRGQWVTA